MSSRARTGSQRRNEFALDDNAIDILEQAKGGLRGQSTTDSKCFLIFYQWLEGQALDHLPRQSTNSDIGAVSVFYGIQGDDLTSMDTKFKSSLKKKDLLEKKVEELLSGLRTKGFASFAGVLAGLGVTYFSLAAMCTNLPGLLVLAGFYTVFMLIIWYRYLIALVYKANKDQDSLENEQIYLTWCADYFHEEFKVHPVPASPTPKQKKISDIATYNIKKLRQPLDYGRHGIRAFASEMLWAVFAAVVVAGMVVYFMDASIKQFSTA